VARVGERRLLAQGREAEVFLEDDGRILKLHRSPDAGERARSEAAAYDALRQAGQRVPQVHGIVTVDGRPGIVMDRVEGFDLLALLQMKPWLVLRVGRLMGELHGALHACAAPDSLPETKDILRSRMEDAPLLSAAHRARALELLDDLPDGDRLCHTDFHIGNLIGTQHDAVAIDWGSASRGDPTGDVAKTLLLHKMASLPEGTPAFFRALTAAGRRVLVGRYLAGYRRHHRLDPALLERWMFVQVAARLGEHVPDEHTTMVAYLDRHDRRMAGS